MRRKAKRDRNHALIVSALRDVGYTVLDLANVGGFTALGSGKMLDMCGRISVLRLITGAPFLATFMPCYTSIRPALSARDESQQPSRQTGRAFFVPAAQEGAMVKQCLTCGRSFNCKPCRAETHNYCSKACFDTTRRVQVTCIHCGKTTTQPANKRSAKFCDKSCQLDYVAAHSIAKVYTCKVCQVEFRSYEAHANTCSAACRDVYEHKDLTCSECGKVFRVRRSHAPLKTYCSKACMAKAYSYRLAGEANPNHRYEQREQMLTCGYCGKFFFLRSYKVAARAAKFCSRRCAIMGRVNQPEANRRSKSGKRADLNNQYFRSAWEANYARYLNWLIEIKQIISWEYEPETFEFTKIKRGERFYTPDFRVTNINQSIEYHEVKGWMDDKSRVKLSRMAKYYPQVKIVVIDSDAYRGLARDVKRFIHEWE